MDKPAPSREADIEAHKNAKLFGENPKLEAFIEAVRFNKSIALVCRAPQVNCKASFLLCRPHPVFLALLCVAWINKCVR